MNFEEMLVIWNLKDAIRDASPLNPHAGFKKIKVRLDPNHAVFIRYNKDGPHGVSLYFDNGTDFKMTERIGISEEATPEMITEVLNMWMKDLV